MYEVKILNKQKKIAYVKWSGVVKPAEVPVVTEKLLKIYEEFNKKRFYIIIDASSLNVFPPETKTLIIEQQKTIVPLLFEVAEISPKTLTKRQLGDTKEAAGNEIAVHFKSVDEALKHLEALSIY